MYRIKNIIDIWVYKVIKTLRLIFKIYKIIFDVFISIDKLFIIFEILQNFFRFGLTGTLSSG